MFSQFLASRVPATYYSPIAIPHLRIEAGDRLRYNPDVAPGVVAVTHFVHVSDLVSVSRFRRAVGDAHARGAHRPQPPRPDDPGAPPHLRIVR